MTPSLSYIICTAPRTGSTLLAQALASTGKAGRPHEYFDIHDENEQFWRRTLAIASDAEYASKAVAAGTTENGVFGLKLLWHQSPRLIAALRAALPADVPLAAATSAHGLWELQIGAPPRYIWLRRRNKIAQAISYLRASKTGRWRSTDAVNDDRRQNGDAAVTFDFDEITRYVQAVTNFDLQWQQYFRQHRVKVLAVMYENFVRSYAETVFSVLDFLQIPRDGVAVTAPRLARQADALSLEWERQFTDMATARGMLRPAAQQPTGQTTAAANTSLPVPAATAPTETRRPRRTRVPKVTTAAIEPPLPLIGYVLSATPQQIVAAPRERDWMNATPVRFAYRCLPMVIANQNGWLILNQHKFAVTWNGGLETAAVKIEPLGGEKPASAVSIFGSGILTFTIAYLFRTAPGYNLHVRGPANMPKDGITALEGIVESDWTEATFTMNWKITRPHHPIVFEAGEPIAMISPLRRGETERVIPELRGLGTDPELTELHREWAQSRAGHNADLKVPGSQAQKNGWQRHYVRGVSIRDEPAREHQTKLSLAEFAVVAQPDRKDDPS